LVQNCHQELSDFDNSKLYELAFLGWYYHIYGVNQLEGAILGCSKMSGHHGGTCFVKFCEETKHHTHLKSSHLSSFFRLKEEEEEDEY
jgi:hypothetical protein